MQGRAVTHHRDRGRREEKRAGTGSHRWGDPYRPTHHETHRGCTRCGMLMTTRHEGGEHWVEYYAMPIELRWHGENRPECHGVVLPADGCPF